MDLVLNGEAYRLDGPATLAGLLRECQAEAGRTAVMVNGEVVRSSQYASVRLSEGDQVELIMIAAGG